MHKQHPQTAYRKYAVLKGTILKIAIKTKACAEPNLLLQSEDVSKFHFCWIQHTTLEQKLQEVF